MNTQMIHPVMTMTGTSKENHSKPLAPLCRHACSGDDGQHRGAGSGLCVKKFGVIREK